MRKPDPRCRDCQRPMELGFLIDHGHGIAYQAAWVSGIAQWSRWTGLKLQGKEKIRVQTYRCPECGRLESYALGNA